MSADCIMIQGSTFALVVYSTLLDMDGSEHQAAVFPARPLITSRTGRTEVSIVATWMGWCWAIRGLESRVGEPCTCVSSNLLLIKGTDQAFLIVQFVHSKHPSRFPLQPHAWPVPLLARFPYSAQGPQATGGAPKTTAGRDVGRLRQIRLE
jgi:hypothetical protein